MLPVADSESIRWLTRSLSGPLIWAPSHSTAPPRRGSGPVEARERDPRPLPSHTAALSPLTQRPSPTSHRAALPPHTQSGLRRSSTRVPLPPPSALPAARRNFVRHRSRPYIWDECGVGRLLPGGAPMVWGDSCQGVHLWCGETPARGCTYGVGRLLPAAQWVHAQWLHTSHSMLHTMCRHAVP
jgi:hypothetical protein